MCVRSTILQIAYAYTVPSKKVHVYALDHQQSYMCMRVSEGLKLHAANPMCMHVAAGFQLLAANHSRYRQQLLSV